MAKHGREKTGSTEYQQSIIDRKQKIAREIYFSLAIKSAEVLEETLIQIMYCVQFGHTPTDKQIREMLNCRSEFQVERKARAIKFA